MQNTKEKSKKPNSVQVKTTNEEFKKAGQSMGYNYTQQI
jgi:hypothetical protein